MSAQKPREMFILKQALDHYDDFETFTARKTAPLSSRSICFREVLPNDLTPEQVIERVVEFLRSEETKKYYLNQSWQWQLQTERLPEPWAKWIESNRDRILKGE